MHKKYSPRLHACNADWGSGCSATWRRMVDIQAVAEENITWVLGNGKVDFWHDN